MGAYLNSNISCLTIYLDQNIFSGLQQEKPKRANLFDLLQEMGKLGAIFVYSEVHVEECRASDKPEGFVDVIEDLPAYLLEPANGAVANVALSLNRARDLILAERDITDDAMRRIEDLLKPIHFAAGWMDDTDAHELQQEMVCEMDAFWESLELEMLNELEPAMHDLAHQMFSATKDLMSNTIRSLPIQQLRTDAQEWQSKLRERLPQNYAQLDAKPAEDVIKFIFSCLDETDQKEIQKQFPVGFWSTTVGRQEGSLTGFAFVLFLMGLVRDARVKKRDRALRLKHFLGQFRDCNHIELASRCAVFMTFDEGAARLAKSVYSYAGVQTQVVHLTVCEP